MKRKSFNISRRGFVLSSLISTTILCGIKLVPQNSLKKEIPFPPFKPLIKISENIDLAG